MIFDGAFGTYILTKDTHINYPEYANIYDPSIVLDIHKEYIASGVTAIKTNTFGSNFNLYENYKDLKCNIESGYKLAKQAVEGTNVKVFADIGPINSPTASDEYIEIADIFIKCGATNFLFETLNEIDNIENVIHHIKSKVKDAMIVTSFAVNQDGYTLKGEQFLNLFDKAIIYGTDCVGLNCICGPSHMLNLIKKIDTQKYKVIAMPNAGYPTTINGRTIYNDNPKYFSDKLYSIYSCGVYGVGGCCGTTPEHIHKFVSKLDKKTTLNISKPKPIKYKHASISKMNLDKTVIAVELPAPSDTNIEFLLKSALKVKQANADFVTIPDSPLGRTKANSFMISSLIQRKIGIKTIPHICCRDKNQIAIEGDLIAANIDNISTVLAITGDPIAPLDRKNAKNVFGFNSFALINFIKNLNTNLFPNNPYNICAALNTSASNFELELKRAKNKIDNGADYLLTQPLFSEKNIENYLKAKENLKCKIFAGIMPPASYRNALFLNNEVPGINIPQPIIDNLKDKSKEQSKDICLSYTKNVIDSIKDNCDGYYIITPLKKVDYSIELVNYIKEKLK